ncbi:hypothetical protein AB6802_01905 [Mesorhizobium sp. RCC_202]|uniref:hypothetical protein n=1 Tax=Mesorhizobium sp. RCC_202 TaxID=3239222 RepID=UPI00352401F3
MLRTSALSSVALALSGLAAHADDAGLWQPQVRAIIGANSNSGFSALEGFLPIKQNLESVLFLDVRSKYDFDDGFGQDVGLGIRRIVNPDLMIGGYAYLNIQNRDSHQFVATTLGLEAITSKYDAHVNVYLPISGDRGSAGQESSLSLAGSQLLEEISAIDHRTYAAWGIEGEVGVQAPIDLPENQSLRFDIGAYHFADPDGDDRSVTGAKAGIEYTFGDVVGKGTSLTFTGEVRNDNRDNTQFAGSVRLTVPFNVPGGSSAGDETDPVSTVSPGLRKRLNERVRGDIGVRLQDQDKVTGTTTRVAINAATNAAFGKFFFADGHNDAGAGTLADPTTLDLAVAGAGANGVVIALGGSGNITTAGVTLANGQTVIGGGGSVQARLINGSIGTYNFGGSNGTIQGTNAANPVITLASNNTLSGITITGGGDGIFGNNAANTTLTNVTVDGAGGNGADFKGDSTNVKASGFTAQNNGIDGLHIEGNGTYNFTGTTLLQANADDGLDIAGHGAYNFATLNALGNHDAGITVKGTGGNIAITGGQVSGNKALGDDGVSIFIDPITANIVLDSITQDGGTSGVVLKNLSGSFTVSGATTISNTTGPAIAITSSPATIRFGDINITNPGGDGMSFTGVNAAVIAGNIIISGIGVGQAGLDFSGSQTNFTAQSLNITGPAIGAVGSIGIDLADTTGDASITITNGGNISGVATGVRLGIAGTPADTANAQFTFGGGMIGGNTASLDARGLNSGSGLYAFGTTTFIGPQLFDQAHLIFIGVNGSGSGNSLSDLASITSADNNHDGAATFVLVNDAGNTPIDANGGFTLDAGQTLASFGNGRTFSLGGLPMNVTGANVNHGTTISDPNGAATLTNTGAGDAVTVASNTSLLDFKIAGVANGVGIYGSNVTGVTLTGMSVSGAVNNDGVFFDSTSSVTGFNLTSTGNGGSGLKLGRGTYTFTGTTTLSNNATGLIVGPVGTYSFDKVDIEGNGTGVTALSVPGAATLSIADGTISGNTIRGFEASQINLDVALSSLSQTSGSDGVNLDTVTGSFSVTGATTISGAQAGVVVTDSSATVDIANLVTTSIAGADVSLTNNTGIIGIGGTITNSGTGDGVVVSGGSAAITVSANISSSATSPGMAVKVDGITGGSVTFSDAISSTGTGWLFEIGSAAFLSGGTISFTGPSLSATGGGGALAIDLIGTAKLNVTAPLSITNAMSTGLVVGSIGSTASATFGAVTVTGAGPGIAIANTAGSVTFGTTQVTLGSAANVAGINFSFTNADVSFGTTTVTMGAGANQSGISFATASADASFGATTVTMGAGANQTGINFSGAFATADFGVTHITGTGDLTSRGIDLSSTQADKTITFQAGSSISNVGVGVELSSGGTTATSANANFTFGDGTSANGLQSSISAAAGGYTVNTIGLNPALGNYNFNDVTFTGPAHLASAVGGTIMVSQNGGVIAAGTDGLSAAVTTVTVAQADAMVGTQTFAFVGTVDLSGTAFTLDSGQSITGFGNGTSILTSGTVQPINVQGNLGATGGNVTGNEGVVKSTGSDTLQLLGNNQVKNTAFDFTGGSGSVFLIDQNAAGFSNAGGIFIDGVTVSNVAVGQTAFKVDGLTTNVSITNNNINVAGTLLDADGGNGDITVTRGTLPNSGPAGTLTGGGISIANRTGGLVNFTDKVTVNGNGVSLTNNTGATVKFADVDITTTNGSTAFSATGGGTVEVDAGTIDATGAQAVALDSIAADIHFTSTSATFSSGSGIDLQNLSGTVALGTGTLINTGSGTAFNVGSATDQSGGNAVISYGGTIASNGTGAAVSIQELTGGSVTLSGDLTDGNAAGGGNIFVGGIDNGTAATVTFSGASKKISSGATTAVQLGYTGNFAAPVPHPNTNATINFNNGGLDITTSGTGFVAAFGGTVSVSGPGPITGNKISSGGDGLAIYAADVGSAGVTFDSISAVSTSNGAGVLLAGSNLGGDVNIGGLTDTGFLGASLGALSGAGVVNFTGKTDLDTSYEGFEISGQVGTINIANVTGSTLTIDGGQVGIAQIGLQTGTVNVGGNGGIASIGATTSTSGSAITLSGGNDLLNATLNYNGSIKVGAGNVLNAGGGDWTVLNMSGSVVSTTTVAGASAAFLFSGHANGVYNISSTIDHQGGIGVRFDGSSDGTVTFSGSSKTFDTGANNAIVKDPAYVPDPQTKGTLNFTNGGLVITTTSGAGFTASTFGSGAISVTGAGNTITTGTGTALKLGDATAVLPGATGATIGAGGITFDSISVNGAATGVSLNDVSGGAINLGAVDLEGITSRGVDISGTLGSALGFTSLKVGLSAANAVGLDLNGAALGASNITAGDFDVDGGSFAGTIGIDMAGTTGTGTIQLGDTINNNPAGQTSTIANVGYGVQFSSATNAKLVFGDGLGPSESSIATTGGQVIHATDSLPTNGDYNFNDVNFTGDTSNLSSISVYYVDLDGNVSGTGDGSLANPGSLAQAQASTANVVVLIDKNVNGSQETLDLSGGTFQIDDGQVVLAFKNNDAAVDVSLLGVDTSGGAGAAFHFTTVQNSPIVSAPAGIDSLRPVLQSNTAGSVINFATSGSGTFTGGIQNLIIRNTGTGTGVAVNATAASNFFLRNNDIAAGGRALDFATTGAPANTLLLSIDGNTLKSTGSALAASFAGQNISATDNSIAIRSFAGNKVTGGTGGGIAFSDVRFDSDGAGGTVSAGSLGIGTPGARVQGNGLSFTNTSGTLDLGTLSLANNGGTGVLVDTKGANTNFTLNNSGGVVTTTNGVAFNLDPLTVNMTFATVNAVGGTSGIIFDGVAGTFTVTGATSISNTTGFGIDAGAGNTGTFNFNTVTVNNVTIPNTGGGIHVQTGTLNVSGLANIDTTSGAGLSQVGGTTSFTGGVTVDTTSGDGMLVINGSAITVTGAANTVTTATGRVVSMQTATIGASGVTFQTLKSTGTVSGGPGIQLSNVSGGTFDGGDASIAGSSNNAITVQNGTSSTVNFNSAVVSSATFNGIDINAGVTGTVTFGTVTIDNTGASGVRLLNTSGTVNINGGSIGATNDPTGSAVEISGGAATLNVAASLTKTSAGKIVDISGVTGGTVTLSGALSANTGSDNGIFVHSNTGGTFNFNGAMTLGTGTSQAVNLATNTGATVNFGGGLAISTTSGAGFSATGGGTVGVAGTTNTITTTSGTALNLNGVTVGAGGVNFNSVSTNGAATGIALTDVASSGGAIALGTVNLQAITSRGVDISGALGAALSFTDLDIGLNSTTGVAFDLNGATINAAVTANDFDVTNAQAAGTSVGVDLRGTTGGQTVRLGDTVANAGASSSIAGVNTGVFLNSTTILAFTFGDGESTTDQNSTIGANVGIDASSAPAAGSYNFQDVNFQASPGLGFGVGKIYFVGASATGDGTGRDQNNLATLSTAEAASVASDILVLVNNGGVISAAGSNADNTLVLAAGEQVRGFGNGNINLALTVPSTIQLASNSISIVDQTPDGAATLTTSAGANAITLGASGNIIDGFILDGGARGIKDNGSGASGTTISHMTIRNFTAAGIEITPSTSTTIDNVTFANNATDVIVNALNTTISNVTSTGATGIAFDLRNTTGTTTLTNLNVTTAATGTGIVFGGASGPGGTINGTNVDISGGSGISVIGGNAAISFNATSSIAAGGSGTAASITNRAGGSFSFAGTVTANGGASGIVISGATAASNVSFGGTVDIGTTTALTGTAVSINNNGQSSVIAFSNIDIVTNGTTGFSATNGGTVNVTTGTVSSTGAQAINLNGVATTTGINFTSTTSTGGTNNVVVSGVTGAGTVSLGTGSLTGASGVAFLGSGGTASVSYSGSITKTSNGRAIDLQNRTGGTVTFNGTVSSTGSSDGIFLNANTGSTINFANTLTIDTSASGTAGFTATGGGTVSATALGSTINSGSGTALNVANTTIGGSGLKFQSISSNGAANGIVLNNTGTSGGLTVMGDGGGSNNGSGGTIQNSTGDGVSLNSTQDVHLAYMNITNNLGDGIGGSGINGFVLNRLNISLNGDSAATDESGINITELTGTASNGAHATSISNSVISNNEEFEIQISNSSGTLTNLQLINNTISANGLAIHGNASSPHGDLVNFLGLGTSVMGLTVTGGSFTGNTVSDATHVITGTGVFGNSGGTSMTVNVSGATFTNNNAGVDVSTDPVATSLTFDIENNTFIGQRSTAINHFDNGNAPFNRTVNGTIKNNTIGDNAVANSGSAVGDGIAISNEGAVSGKYLIDGNKIYQVATAPGISVNIGLGGQATGGGETDLTITNNIFDHINGSRAITVQDNQVTDIATPPGAGPFPTVWLNLQGNSFANIAGQAGNGQYVRLKQSYGIFKVTQSAATAGANVGELDDANGINDPTKFSTSSTSGSIQYGQGAAPLPTTNPLP